MNIQQALIYTMDSLKSFPEYKVDAFCLIKYITELSDLDVLTKSEYILTKQQENLLKNCIKRRLKHEPIAYIIGYKEFFGEIFYVNNHTLIPRPETELIVEKTLEYIKKKNLKRPTILELGVGSGAIILSVSKNCSVLNSIGVDINKEALKIANQNAKKLNLENCISFIQSNWFENIKNQKFDIIISNPPYIERNIIKSLDEEVKCYEPITALDGGESGLDDYKKIIKDAPKYLKKNGMILLEIGYNQKQEVLSLLNNNTWTNKKCFKDLSNNDRIIIAELINSK